MVPLSRPSCRGVPDGAARRAVDDHQGRLWFQRGPGALPTLGGAAESWNDINESNFRRQLNLVDTTGRQTGVWYTLKTGTNLEGSNSQGIKAPEGEMGALPGSATEDSLWHQWSQGRYHTTPQGPYGTSRKAVIELSNLDPNSLYHFQFTASRLGVTDVRTTEYAVQGWNGGVAVVDAANNVSEVGSVMGVLADPSGKISVTVEAASSNTSPEQFYYLGAMVIRAVKTAQRPVVLDFDAGRLRASRPETLGPFSAQIAVVESRGEARTVALSVVDAATGNSPTWLTAPSTVASGSPFAVTFDGSGEARGAHRATITGRSAGYPDFDLDVELLVRDPDIKNVLVYGNSFTGGRGCGRQISVPEFFQAIAEESHATPNVIARIVGSTYLSFHRSNPVHVAAISDSLRLGETWDWVVIQGFSTEATETLGNPAAFRADAIGIVSQVQAHSPNVRATMFQTWARAPGHPYYPNTFSGPAEMHEQVQTNYRRCVAEMNQLFGAGTVELAAAGDAVELQAFDPSIYCPDLYHGAEPLSLMCAMTIYTSVYGERMCDIDPDFSAGGSLVTLLGSAGLRAGDWRDLGGTADRVAALRNRLYPGSTEDLLLQSGVNGPTTPCPIERVAGRGVCSVSVTSPNTSYGNASVGLFAQAFATGAPPGPFFAFPEVQFDPSSAVLIGSRSRLGAGLSVNLDLPLIPRGVSLLIQGLALKKSTERERWFTTTDGHEVVFQ